MQVKFSDTRVVRIVEFDGETVNWEAGLFGDYNVSIPAGVHTLGIATSYETKHITFEFLPGKAYNVIISVGRFIPVADFEFREAVIYNITINFKDKRPGGFWTLYLIKDDLTGVTSDNRAMAAARNFVATGTNAQAGGKTAKLTNGRAPGGQFDGSGTYTLLFQEATAAGLGKIKYLEGVTFHEMAATVSFSSMKDLSENIEITGEQTELEGVWKNTNRNQSVYTFRGDTFKMVSADGKSGNGGTFSFTGSLLSLNVTYTLVNGLSVETPARTVEMHYSFEGGNLIMWSEGLPNQKWIYEKK